MTGFILGLDTAMDALSVAVGTAEGPVATCWQRRARGHAEQLVPMMQRVLETAGLQVSDLAAIAVTVGPGTFTGVRIGLAAARGMRLAHPVPLIGVTTLELLAARAARRWPDRPILAALDARRDQVYTQMFRRADGGFADAWSAPAAMSAEAAAGMLVPETVLTGSGAHLIAAHTTTQRPVDDQVTDATDMIRLVHQRGLPKGNLSAPDPLYLRAPDATPARPLLQR